VPQIRLARQLNAEAATAIDPLREKLEAVGQFIVRNCRMHASFSGSTHLRAPTEAWISELASVAAVAETVERAAWPVPANRSGRAEGLAFMADVAYCARCFPAPHASDPDSASVQVLAQLLSFDYLWDEIRAKGGAYGGFCAYGAGSQVFELLSYRDPHIERTLDVFDRTREYLLNIKWSQKEIERAVIGSAKTDDIPVRPGWATAAALWRHLGRLTEQLRQERRQQLLAVTPEQIRSVALSLFEENYQHGNSCVLASRQQLTAASQRLAEPLVIEDVLADFTPAGDAS
jgi:Zn-dependent M16 (insulinase) family peptidase